MPYAASDWSGTVSFWLRVDPRSELEPGFCDPVQITPRAWNDAAFFVEFEKRPESIPFRLGVYANLDVWNPTKRKFEEIPASERPLVTVTDPPFAGNKWTHVVFTFERFNTGKPDGVARLYLDGEPRGVLAAAAADLHVGPGAGDRRPRPQLHRVARRAVDFQPGARGRRGGGVVPSAVRRVGAASLSVRARQPFRLLGLEGHPLNSAVSTWIACG